MATSQLNTVFQHLRRIVLIRDGAGLTDGQLLESFISQRDEAAFEALVRRLGPMVLKVCRRVVGNHHDAEDAFQATFLVLARKASSVKSRDMLANWLHGVALRTALKARTLRLKTQARERHVSNLPEPEAAPANDSQDLKPLLDQELSRLAEIYRLPILLCNLEGKSIKETAQQLGWPQGTVAGRLARGKIILAKRLARHGLATTAGAAVLENSLSACVPPSLVAATVKAASVYAAGKSAATGMIAANVAVLMEGVMKAMFFTKIKIAAGVLVVGSVIALGGGVLVNGTAEGQQTEAAKSGEKSAKHQAAPSKGKADAGKKDGTTPKTEHDKFRGTWRVIEWNSHGKKDIPLQMSRWSIGKYRIVMNPAPLKTTKSPTPSQYASYQFWGDHDDAAPAANNINMTIGMVVKSHDGKEDGISQQTFRGIFEWDGDRLRLCFRQLVFGTRPTAIPVSPSKDDNLFIVVLKRETAAPTTDEEKLQGDWRIVSGEVAGESFETNEASIHVSFVGDLMICPEEETDSTFQLDATKNPKQIFATCKFGKMERRIAGIYSLDGDELKFCWSQEKDSPPPNDFTAAKGSGRQMFVLKRVKSAGEGVTAPQARADLNHNPTQSRADRSKDKTAQTPKSAMSDWERIQGIWELVSEESEGKARKFEKTVLMVDGKAVCIQTAGDGDIMVGLHLDPTHDPKTFELVMNTQTREGIYELDGDTLRMCGDVGHEPKRPTRFATEPGSHQSLVVFKRLHGREVFPYPRADGRSRFPEIVARRKSDHYNLPGTWLVTELDFGGTKRAVPDMRWFIGKDKIVISQADHVFGWPAKERQEATYQFWGDNGDAAPSPNNINMTMEMVNESPHAASRFNFRGVFQVDGDKLKLCFRQRSLGTRPTTIPSTSSKGDNLLIVVLERQTAAPKTDVEKIQGDWKLVAEEAEGKRDDESDDGSEPEIFSFVGDLMIWKSEEEQEAVFKLDSAKNPKHITTIYKSNGVERKMLGIYSLNGDDLKICFQHVEKEGPRPDAFTTTKGSGRQVFILKRMKSAAEGGAPAQAPRVIDTSKKPARADRVAEQIDGGGQGILIALYDELKSGCLDLKKANCEIWAQEVKNGRIIRPVVVHRDSQGRSDLILMAEEGELKVDWAKGTLAIVLFKVAIISRTGDKAYCESRDMPLGSIEDAR